MNSCVSQPGVPNAGHGTKSDTDQEPRAIFHVPATIDSMSKQQQIPLNDLLAEVRACRVCEEFLPLGPKPVLRAKASARILIIGQAPGTKVHATGIPWNDASGDRLREWMGVTREVFYDEDEIAIVPMGFCYPGRGKGGDLPPRPECAPLWHGRILAALPNIEFTMLVGSYAQAYYLKGKYKSLTERVRDWRSFTPSQLPLVHPSPRNIKWRRDNPWFEEEVVPYLQKRVKQILSKSASARKKKVGLP